MRLLTADREYNTTELIAHGDFCDVYVCSIDNQRTRKAIFKVVRDKSDNDLLENEAAVLSDIWPEKQIEEQHFRFLTRLLGAGEVEGKRVNVTPYFPDNISLSRVLAAYPDGIDFKDMIWMYKRTLDALGFVHQRGYVHGAVIPPHVMIGPVDHGVRLVDWSYAVRMQDLPEGDDGEPTRVRLTAWERLAEDDVFDAGPHIKAISKGHREFYAPEVEKREVPTAATDIYMATKCAEALVGGSFRKLPPKLQDLLQGQLRTDPMERAQDAWTLFDLVNGTLKEEVGPRKYREFTMPSGG